GSGIFIVSADILRQVHSPGLLLTVWLLSGVVTLLGALSYGELAAMFPKAGGQYVYLREGISPLFGYLYGWTLFVVIQTGTIAANLGANFWAGGGLTLAVLPVVCAAMVGSLFSMDAWNNVGFASGELKNPERDIPFAMAAGVITVTTLYVLANVAYLVVLPQDAIAHAPQDRVGTAALQAMF